MKISGGIGNQMWQYAYGRALSIKLQTELKLDFRNFFPGKRMFALQYYDIHAGFLTDEDRTKLRMVKQNQGIPSMEQPFDEDNIYLVGYWHNPHYLKIAEKQIRSELQLRAYLREDSLRWLDKIKNSSCAVSVHIRRGDYLLEKNQGVYVNLPLSYYYDAVAELKKRYNNIELYIFSNDTKWCQEHFCFDVPYYYVDCNDENHGFEDLYLMSQCRHHIIANSTFSWWGAWLGGDDDKCVVAPNRLFVSDEGYWSAYNKEWLPDEWLRINV